MTQNFSLGIQTIVSDKLFSFIFSRPVVVVVVVVVIAVVVVYFVIAVVVYIWMYFYSWCIFIQVLNELLIDRGSAQSLSNLDVYCNDRLITSVQGDGKLRGFWIF